MGSQEVLGQAARLASSSLLLQVLCCANFSASRGGCPGFPRYPVPRESTAAGRGAGLAVGRPRSESWRNDCKLVIFFLKIAFPCSRRTQFNPMGKTEAT